MRRVTFATTIAMLFLFAFVPTPVHADCAADIEAVEEEIDSSGGSKLAEGDVRAARNLVKKAKAALAEGKKKKCENLIKKAQDRLGNR
jgi:hypothetical protein